MGANRIFLQKKGLAHVSSDIQLIKLILKRHMLKLHIGYTGEDNVRTCKGLHWGISVKTA